MHTPLLQDISKRHTLSEQDIAFCIQYFEPVLFPKNKVIEEAGKVPQYLYYILSGFMRLFYYDDNGDEVTVHINCPNGFFTAFAHFSNQTISPLNVDCITECELLRISKPDYDMLIGLSLVWKDYALYVLQESAAYNEGRSNDLAILSAEQRYRKLIATHPEIIQNVPLQYIASFLGIKPESLSRIRRTIVR